MKYSIIAPGFRNPGWLKLCLACAIWPRPFFGKAGQLCHLRGDKPGTARAL